MFPEKELESLIALVDFFLNINILNLIIGSENEKRVPL